MKGLVLLQNGFEDTEAILTIDVLRRGKHNIVTTSLNEDEEVLTQYNNLLYADSLFREIDVEEFDFLVIPGGKAVKKSLYDDPRVKEIVKYFMDSNKLVAAICAAPSILGKYGYLDGKEFTCFPGNEVGINGTYSKQNVVRVDNIITARSMYYSMDFALEIIKFLDGNEKASILEESLKG